MNAIVVDETILAQRDQIVARLRNILPEGAVLDGEDQRRAYETDAQTMHKQVPLAVVLPENTEQVSQVLAPRRSLPPLARTHESRVSRARRGN